MCPNHYSRLPNLSCVYVGGLETRTDESAAMLRIIAVATAASISPLYRTSSRFPLWSFSLWLLSAARGDSDRALLVGIALTYFLLYLRSLTRPRCLSYRLHLKHVDVHQIPRVAKSFKPQGGPNKKRLAKDTTSDDSSISTIPTTHKSHWFSRASIHLGFRDIYQSVVINFNFPAVLGFLRRQNSTTFPWWPVRIIHNTR